MASQGKKVTQKVVKNEAEVQQELCHLVEKLAAEAIKARGKFKIGVSGGSVAKYLSGGLASINTEWDKWVVFFCDERLVSFDSDDSTWKLYRESVVGLTPLTSNQFVRINPDLEVSAAAQDYEQKMRVHFPNCTWPDFDLLALGMGPDGHTASLFPGHQMLEHQSSWVVPISNSPKPPPCRITMTLPVINSAHNCVFAISGQAKAEMVKRILVLQDPLPATRVKPVHGVLVWILDEAAASKL